MQTINITDAALNISGTITVPDEVVYVFNPNYVDVSLGSFNGILKLSVSDGTKSYEVEVSLFRGKAHSYVSKLMQILFDDYVAARSKTIIINLATKDGTVIYSGSFMALWASVEQGMKFGYYLPFVYDRGKSPKYIREVVWFKNFPFRVSLFRKTRDFDVYGQADNGTLKTVFSRAVQVSAVSPRRRAPAYYDYTDGEDVSLTEKILSEPATKTIDLGQLNEAGLEIDLARTGIYDISQLSTVALGDVVIRRSRASSRDYSAESAVNWSDFIESGLDIITYETVNIGKTGIFELSPDTMFENTQRQLIISVMKAVPENAKFDANFDIKFDDITEVAYIVKLTVNDNMDGIYLRWIDQFGFWQYFLFIAGVRTSQNKLGKITVDAEYESRGVLHGAQRYIHVDNTDTQKCCAVSLRKEILAYVKTISKSPHVEMFLGIDIDQNEMWKPVNIVGDKMSINPNQHLYDYEISFTLPDTASQTI